MVAAQRRIKLSLSFIAQRGSMQDFLELATLWRSAMAIALEPLMIIPL
jgi:hypothetical protein